MNEERLSNLIEFRHKLQLFYAERAKYVRAALRFAAALITLLGIRASIPFSGVMSSVPVAVLLAAVCAFVPWGVAAFICGAAVLVNLYALSPLAMVVFAVFMVIVLCCYYIFSPGDSVILLLVPILFFLKIPCALPVVIGLCFTGISVVPLLFGVIACYFVSWVAANSVLLAESSMLTSTQQFTYLVTGVLCSPQTIGCLIAFGVTALTVFTIRKLAVRYNWEAAVIAGSLACLILQTVLAAVLDYRISFAQTLIGIAVGAALGFILRFFLYQVDYRSTVETQFEDDEYFYYVKAVPKMDVHPEDKQLKKFVTTSRRKTLHDDPDRLAVYLGFEPEIDTGVFDDEEPAESSVMTNTKPLDATIEGVAAAEDAAMEVTTVVNMSTQTEELPVLETAAAVGDLFDDED